MKLRTSVAAILMGALLLNLFAQGEVQPRRDERRGREGALVRGAQFGAGQNVTLILLGRPDVQAELKLTEEQKVKMSEALAKRQQELGDVTPEGRRQRMQALRAEMEREVLAVLTPEQQQRLKQLALQWQGPLALNRPEVAKEVGLTSEQQSKIQGIIQNWREEQRAIMRQRPEPGQGAAPLRQKMEELRAKIEKEIESVLTGAQRQKWQSMLGEPFKFEGGRGIPRRLREGPPQGDRPGGSGE